MPVRETDTLMGPAEVRKHLGGISRPAFAKLRARADFPAPREELEIGPVWDGATIRQWHEDRMRDRRAPREEAVRLYRQTGSVTETARQLGKDRGSVTSWLREAGEPLPRDVSEAA